MTTHSITATVLGHSAEVHFTFTPGEAPSRTSPGCGPDVDLHRITIGELVIDDVSDLGEDVIEALEEKAKEAVADHDRNEREAYEEARAEAWRDRQWDHYLLSA